jgi:hypothetical protein
VADGQSTVYVRWGISSDSSWQFSGWNIDDVTLTGTPLATPSAAPASVDLVSASDTGGSDSDNLTRLDNSSPASVLQFDVAGTVAGATVTLYAGATAIGTATASGPTTTVATGGAFDLADGLHTITATQTEPGKTESLPTAGLAITVDTVIPTPEIVGVAPDPRSTAVDSIQIAFSEPVAGLALSHLSLTLDGDPIALAGATLEPGDPAAYTASYTLGGLAALTAAPGGYVLALSGAGTGIADLAGNEIQTGAADQWAQFLAVLAGTDGDDTVAVSIGPAGPVVTINGTVHSYSTAVTEIRIDSGEGRDSITLAGTGGDETATLRAGSVDLLGPGYQVYATSVEVVTINGGGGADQATLEGSSGSNRLYSYAGYTLLTDSTKTFYHRVENFGTVAADATAGSGNYAFLYDSPGADVLTAGENQVALDRAAGSSDTTADGFARVYVYSTGGGDTAELSGSSASANRFYSYPAYSILTDSQSSRYYYAAGFDLVTATAAGTGPHYAYFYDSDGDDVFSATPAQAVMNRADAWTDATAIGFARVYAYSTRGGADTATLAGSAVGGNRYRGYPAYSTLTDTSGSFYHYANGFRQVTAAGSPTATDDIAYLYDSGVADIFVGKSYWGELKAKTDTPYLNRVEYFDRVYAYSNDATSVDDEIDVDSTLAYNLILSGSW